MRSDRLVRGQHRISHEFPEAYWRQLDASPDAHRVVEIEKRVRKTVVQRSPDRMQVAARRNAPHQNDVAPPGLNITLPSRSSVRISFVQELKIAVVADAAHREPDTRRWGHLRILLGRQYPGREVIKEGD